MTRPGLRALVCKWQTREVLSSPPQAGRWVTFREHRRVNSGERQILHDQPLKLLSSAEVHELFLAMAWFD